MGHFGIYLLLLLSLSNSYPLYTLYSGPYQLSDPLRRLDFSSDQQMIIMPDQSQLIIAIQLMPYFQTIILQFFSINNGVISKFDQISRQFLSSQQLIDAFWIDSQYLLIIGDQWKIFNRPQFNDQPFSYQQVFDDFTDLAAFVRKQHNGENQLTNIIQSTDQWLLRKQALTFNSSVLIQIITLCKIAKNEYLVKLIKLKNFQCALLRSSILGITYDYRFSCYRSASNQVYLLTFSQKFKIVKADNDQAADTVYIVGGTADIWLDGSCSLPTL